MEQVDLNNYENDALQDVDELLELVLPRMNRVDFLSDPPDSTSIVTLLGDFLDGQLANLGWSVLELSRRTHIDADFLDGILHGKVNDKEITDEILIQLAHAIDYEPNVLRIVMGRKIVATTEFLKEPPEDNHDSWEHIDNFVDDLEQEIDERLKEITELLLQTVDNRYSSDVRYSEKKQKHHDFVIRQIQMIIAKHRSDARRVELLVEELKSSKPNDQQTPKATDEPDLNRIDIRRIIHFIETSSTR